MKLSTQLITAAGLSLAATTPLSALACASVSFTVGVPAAPVVYAAPAPVYYAPPPLPVMVPAPVVYARPLVVRPVVWAPRIVPVPVMRPYVAGVAYY